MPRPTRIALAAAGALFAAATTAWTQTPALSSRATHLAAAQAAQAVGDYPRALEEYNAALNPPAGPSGTASPSEGRGGRGGAAGVPDPASVDAGVRVPIALNYARMLEAWAAADPREVSRLVKAEELYLTAINTGTPAERNLARNDLGALQLRQNRNAEALATLRAVDLGADPLRRFVYRFNLARALEVNGQYVQARAAYVATVTDNPTFAPAIVAALSLLEQRFDAGVAKTLATTLLAAKQLDATERVTRRLLPLAGDDFSAMPLLALRLGWQVDARIDVATFREREEAVLASARPTRVLQATQAVRRVFLDENLPIETVSGSAPRPFPLSEPWIDLAIQFADPKDTNAMPRAFGRLLKYVGDLYAARENHRAALARYLDAWSVDKADGESAVYAAMMIQTHPDLDGNKKILDSLIARIFLQKGDYIAAQDWPNSQRLHIVLATIFEGLGRWQPESDTHTALFQWLAAVGDEREIRNRTPSRPPSPGVYFRLAQCYDHVNQHERAREYYRQAADAFKTLGRTEEAANSTRLAQANNR